MKKNREYKEIIWSGSHPIIEEWGKVVFYADKLYIEGFKFHNVNSLEAERAVLKEVLQACQNMLKETED